MKTLFAIFLATVSIGLLAYDKVCSYRVFDANSFWYQPIPIDAPFNPNNQALVTEFIKQKDLYYKYVGINTVGGTSPVWNVGPAQATVSVDYGYARCGRTTLPTPDLLPQWAAVPIPSYAVPATGGDAEMTVYQPSTDTFWEFWKMAKDPATGLWSACWGGRMEHASQSDGIWPLYFGTTATGLPFLGGQITSEEIASGSIEHVMGIAVVAASKTISWPALRGDGYGNSILQEGMRFRLDPTIDVESLPLNSFGKIVARAAQKYGFVIWDKTNSVVALRGESSLTQTQQGLPNPWPALLAGKHTYDVLNGIPWDRLQFLPMNYGKP